MNIFSSIIMGVVQGLTEFLPVSSSGHLVILEKIFKITENQIFINVALHIATLFAVIIVFRKDIISLIRKPFCHTNLMLALSVIPTVMVVLLLKGVLENSFTAYPTIGFIVTAIILATCQMLTKKEKNNNPPSKNINIKNTEQSTYYNLSVTARTALITGLVQGGSVFPGISRSGSTICALLFCGVKRENTVKFSFIMSIPIIFASMVYELFKLQDTAFSINWLNIAVGFIFALGFGILAIKIMLKIVKQANYICFSVYLILLSIFLLLNEYSLFWF